MALSKDEKTIVQLRDCFTAGYTLPQYCIDNGIKKPLFVAEKNFELFAWQIYVQFCYDKRLTAQFSFFDAVLKVNYSATNHIRAMKNQMFSDSLLKACDKIFVLSSDKSKVTSDKAIYLDELTNYFIIKTYFEIPLLHFLQLNPKVKLIVTNFPGQIKQYEGGAAFEKSLPTTSGLRDLLVANPSGNVKTQLDRLGYTNKEVLELVEVPKIEKKPDGTTPLRDTVDKFLHPIRDGRHITAYQPEHFQNRIWFVGSCHQYGINAPFDKTTESFLQKMLNDANLPYRVENAGQHYWGRRQDLFYNLNKIKFEPNDIIFVWHAGLLTRSLPFIDLSNAFAPPHDYREIFIEKEHGNELGYKILAERYFKFLTENNFFHDVEQNYNAPPPALSQIWYTFLGGIGRNKIFSGAYGLCFFMI